VNQAGIKTNENNNSLLELLDREEREPEIKAIYAFTFGKQI